MADKRGRDPVAVRFGLRLRELREAAGLTQQQLADRVGCSWEALSTWEGARRVPLWTAAVALADALGVGVGEFTAEPSPGVGLRGPGRPAAQAEEPPEPPPKKRGRPPGRKPRKK